MDGTVGELMERTNISHMRPAHIHFAVSAPGYYGLVTHLFQKGGEYLETDVVYAVKAPLIVEWVEKPPGNAPTREMMTTPFYELKYDFVLAKARRRSPRLSEQMEGGRSVSEGVMPRIGGASSEPRPL